jgi:4-hydroxy-3-polyprenylbenzoate decarboxylase
MRLRQPPAGGGKQERQNQKSPHGFPLRRCDSTPSFGDKAMPKAELRMNNRSGIRHSSFDLRHWPRPATIVGMPPMEDFYIGSASVKLFLPIFKMNFPEIVDIALPAEGVFHNLVFVSIKKTYPMQARRKFRMTSVECMGQMMFTKYIVVVDDDVSVHNTSEVLFRLCANTDPQRDSIFTKGPADVLDHATSEIAMGTKLGIDATRKLAGEGFKRPWPPLIKMDEAVKQKINQLFNR